MEETTDLVELVHNSSLISITTHDLHAVSTDSGEAPPADEEGMKYELQTRRDDGSFGLRVRATLDHPRGHLQVTIAADYANSGPPPSDDVLADFGPEVGFMALYPYIRQAVSYLSSTVLGEHLLLEIVRREDLAVTRQDPAEH